MTWAGVLAWARAISDPAVGEQRLEHAAGGDGVGEAVRDRLVQDEQVDDVDAELLRGRLERLQRLIAAVVGDPHLGLEEHLLAESFRQRPDSLPPGERADGYAGASELMVLHGCLRRSVRGGRGP